MSLLELWKSDRQQIAGKRLDQLIAFAGEGKLNDDGQTATELRSLLRAVPSEQLEAWKDEALNRRYDDFGFVLQDIMNEVGHRLGFEVRPGRYRGRTGYSEPDGLWRDGDHLILVEVKASARFQIDIAGLLIDRVRLADFWSPKPTGVSGLLIIADQQTAELEAQVRGSRFAWDVRLLGVDAAFSMLRVRERVDDPAVGRQIKQILVPQEFTRLDAIVELVLATAEEAEEVEPEAEPEIDGPEIIKEHVQVRVTPASFHDRVLPRLARHFGDELVKRGRIVWATPDDATLVTCQVSKQHEGRGGDNRYWFAVKRKTALRLAEHPNAYCAFACGSPEQLIVLPYDVLSPLFKAMPTSADSGGGILHWHVTIRDREGTLDLITNGEADSPDLRQYQIGADHGAGDS